MGSLLRGAAALAVLVSFGCGDDPQGASGGDAADESTTSDSADVDISDEVVDSSPDLSMNVEGYESNDGGASAQILIREDDGVRLTISGGVEEDGFLLFTLQLEEPDAILGEHDLALELPLPEVRGSVSAHLGELDYVSQGGQIHLSIDPSGIIEGDFSVELGELPEDPTTRGLQIQDEFETVSGTFSGDFSLACYSRIPAHATWLEGGTFCTELGYN